MSENKNVFSIVSGFLNYLDGVGKRRLLPEIIKELETKVNYKKVVLLVESAGPLTLAQKKKFILELKKKYDSNAIRFEVDKNLLGGFKVTANDEVLDFSTKAKLDYFSQNI